MTGSSESNLYAAVSLWDKPSPALPLVSLKDFIMELVFMQESQ
jgi:hypothetical protein